MIEFYLTRLLDSICFDWLLQATERHLPQKEASNGSRLLQLLSLAIVNAKSKISTFTCRLNLKLLNAVGRGLGTSLRNVA